MEASRFRSTTMEGTRFLRFTAKASGLQDLGAADLTRRFVKRDPKQHFRQIAVL